MPKFIDLTGKKFGRLAVVKRVQNKGEYVCFECLCDCGKTKIAIAQSLSHGRLKSCGCLATEIRKELGKNLGKLSKTHQIKHEKCHTKIYSAWTNMRARVSNKKLYPGYAKRGITVCERWDKSFNNFYADMGDIPFKGASLDRIDNTRGYSPENCRWADRKTQAFNTSRNKRYTISDKTMTITQWSTYLGGSPQLIRTRLDAGWTLQRALTTKVIRQKNSTHRI